MVTAFYLNGTHLKNLSQIVLDFLFHQRQKVEEGLAAPHDARIITNFCRRQQYRTFRLRDSEHAQMQYSECGLTRAHRSDMNAQGERLVKCLSLMLV